jgi:hypothetical protein
MNEGLNVAALATAGVSLLAAVLVYVNSRRANRTNEKKAAAEDHNATFALSFDMMKYIDQRVEEKVAPIRQRLEEQEARDRTRTNAFVRVLRAISFQWPREHPGPVLDPVDIESIEDTIPPHWLREGGTPKQS